jgi:tetratricopeptide (TPR) repeat protein
LCNALRFAGRFAEAATIEVEILATSRRVYGDTHTSTLVAASNHAQTLERQGNFTEAATLVEDVIARQEEANGDDDGHPLHLIALGTLARIYGNQGKSAESVVLLQRILDARLHTLPKDDPDTVTTTANLAVAYSALGRFHDAVKLEREVFTTRKRVLGEGHADTLIAAGNLACTLRKLGNFEVSDSTLEMGFVDLGGGKCSVCCGLGYHQEQVELI